MSSQQNSSDIILLNTHNNLIDRNFQTEARHTLQNKVNELADEERSIKEEWQNYKFHYKVIIVDLFDDDYEET